MTKYSDKTEKKVDQKLMISYQDLLSDIKKNLVRPLVSKLSEEILEGSVCVIIVIKETYL